jgi:hypothetical protein
MSMKPPAAPKDDSFREKIIIALLGFILTGVLGGTVTTWIQQRGWAWQNRVAKIDKDVQNALAAYQGASDLINARWHATYRMTRAIERDAPPDEWKGARDEFAGAERDWAIRYTNVARDVAFYVDTPFGRDSREQLKLVWPFGCDNYAYGPDGPAGLDSGSARVTLELVNHCNALTKDALEKAADSPTGAPPSLDPAARKTLVAQAYQRLDAIYRTNEALRCVIFELALAIRQSAEVDSYWSSFFGIGEPTYKAASDGKDCAG